MKKTALLLSILSFSITPSLYAAFEGNFPPVVEGQYGAVTCDQCESSSCLCNTPNHPTDQKKGDETTNYGTPPMQKDGQFGATTCQNCGKESCLCGDSSNTDPSPVPAPAALPNNPANNNNTDNNNNNSTSSNAGDSMNSSSNDAIQQ